MFILSTMLAFHPAQHCFNSKMFCQFVFLSKSSCQSASVSNTSYLLQSMLLLSMCTTGFLFLFYSYRIVDINITPLFSAVFSFITIYIQTQRFIKHKENVQNRTVQPKYPDHKAKGLTSGLNKAEAGNNWLWCSV